MTHTHWLVSLAFVLGAAHPIVHADPGGSCHFHGKQAASETVVTTCAKQRRDALVKAGRLEASWASAPVTSAEVVEGKKGKEWKVQMTNPTATDPTKRTLYLFFSHPGNFIAANFTGQ